MPWTLFWDMHSGGGRKVPPYESIYIEAPKADAVGLFYQKFGRNPRRVTCTCCGEDYAINESKTLEEASSYLRGDTDYHRRTRRRKPMSVAEYEARPDVLVLRGHDLEGLDASCVPPDEGFVWA